MKRIMTGLVAAALLLLSLGGCGNSASSQAENKAAQTSKKTINDILAESQAMMTTEPSTIVYPALEEEAEVDLTTLSPNMVYSTVYNMVTNPAAFEGKTVKANGTFDVTTKPATGEMFYFCVIADATACCAQGLEFKPEEELKYPDDFPEVNAPIAVWGVFESYEEDGKTYCRLNNAHVSWEPIHE